MMSTVNRQIIIEHEGETYYGYLAQIDKTSLSYEDHGILTAWVTTSWPGGGVTVGGYCLDQPKDRDSRDYSRVGTAYGLDYLICIMKTVGVEEWESLPGQKVIVLFDSPSTAGLQAKGIAGVLNDEIFIPRKHADQWLTKEHAS
jgi:hypothetical protein